MFASGEGAREVPTVLSRKGLLGERMLKPKANRVPAIKASLFPNKTPNLDVTEPGAYRRRQD